ncbi:MAG: hypothetical protein ABI811_08830 [Acidobacteriota bacterium]
MNSKFATTRGLWCFTWRFLAIASTVHAQGVITTIAGTEFAFPDLPIRALDAPIGRAAGGAFDQKGNFYFADSRSARVFKLDTGGALSAVAGNGLLGFTGDGGQATHASLFGPNSVVPAPDGSIFVSDSGNNRIRKITSDGVIRTVAGTGTYAYGGDGGTGLQASLALPQGLAVDTGGNLYIADLGNSRIRKLTPGGIISTVAGTGNFAFGGDGGQATQAAIGEVRSVAVDAAGNIFFPSTLHHRIRKVANGIISTVAGSGTDGFFGDGGDARLSSLSGPQGVSVDSSGNLYIADTANNRIRVVSGGIIRTVAGSRLFSFTGDGGPAVDALLAHPTAAVPDALGNVYVTDSDNRRIRVISRGVIQTIAGNGNFQFSGDGGPAVAASLFSPASMTFDSLGNLLFSDSQNVRIRRISADGKITTIAGNGITLFAGDGGPAAQASFFNPDGVAVDAAGNIYIADSAPSRVRKVSLSGVITTIAGNGNWGTAGDGGPAAVADLYVPKSLVFDGAGNLYIGESGGIRKVTPAGIISRVAGSGGSLLAEGGLATAAAVSEATAMVFDRSGNLIFADARMHIVRRISTSGIITTIAGTATAGFTGDGGLARNARLDSPSGVAVDFAGNYYISDQNNHRIRRVTSDGLIRTYAGTGQQGISGDGGLAANATFTYPDALAFDAAGNLLIADANNNRIRSILAKPPEIRVNASGTSQTARSGGASVRVMKASILSPVAGLAFSVSAASPWLTITPASGVTPREIEVFADPSALAPGNYTASITLTAVNASPVTTNVPLSLQVTPGRAAQLSLDKANFSFTYPRNAQLRAQILTISNSGDGALNFSVNAQTNAGGSWLRVTPGSGIARAGAPILVDISADPTGLASGAYRGSVTVTSNGGQSTIPVVMTVSISDRAILLSKTGLSFTTIAQGGLVPSQTLGVLNIGQGIMDFTVETSTLAGGSWLIATPASGSSDAAGSPPLITVRVNPVGLAPDVYYGLVKVRAAGAANTPQVATVMLEVLPAGSDLGAILDPPELVFSAVEGGASPSSQDILIYNPTAVSKTFHSAVSTVTATSWLARLPVDSTVIPSKPTTMVVQPVIAGLAAGTHRGAISLQFDDGRLRTLGVVLVVAPAGTILNSATSGPRAATGCVAKELIPVITSLGQDFTVPAGWPIGLQAQVQDDCGRVMESGTVVLEFSNGDPPLKMTALKTGRWDGTWQTGSRSSNAVTVTVTAEDNKQKIRGRREIAGGLGETRAPPLLRQEGIVSIASPVSYLPVSPGGFITLYGERLSQGVDQARSLPLSSELAGTIVTINEKRMPLQYAQDGQLNAVIPFGIEVNTSHQILVQRGTTYSQPVPVDVAAVQPGIFVLAGGQGIITGPSNAIADPLHPVHRGDPIVIWAAGIGDTTPSVPAGNGAPTVPLAYLKDPLELTIGGVPVPTVFAGLAPQLVAVYQIVAYIPQDAPKGAAVPVVLRTGGQTSQAVSIAIE